MIIDSFPLDFPRAYGSINISADFRQKPEDFFVQEILGFQLSGEGEHLCLLIEKTGHNTHWVAQQIAQFFGVKEYDVGVCGRKDRHAITQQWFSIYDPLRKKVNWPQWQLEGVKILDIKRHHKKLRRGDHLKNYFKIRLRQVNFIDEQRADKPAFIKYIHNIVSQGIPNYFGPQRFGNNSNNLLFARDWFEQGIQPPAKQRSMILSAARSYLFNQVLALRLQLGNWNTLLAGERLVEGKPSGCLWGRGRLPVSDQVLEIEHRALEPYEPWCERLEHMGLKQERRSLVLSPENFSCSWAVDDLCVEFELPRGTFATAVLQEFSQLHDKSRQ